MELVEGAVVGGQFVVAAMEAITLYLTILSGYLIVAYAVGRDLSTFQAIIITAIFVVFASFFVTGTYEFFNTANVTHKLLSPETYPERARLYSYWIVGTQIAGIIAALAFMYDARRK